MEIVQLQLSIFLYGCNHCSIGFFSPAWMEPMCQCSLAASSTYQRKSQSCDSIVTKVSFLPRPSPCCQSISFSLISTLSSLALSTKEQCSWGCQSYEITTSVTVVSSSWKKCLAAVLDQLHYTSLICSPRVTVELFSHVVNNGNDLLRCLHGQRARNEIILHVDDDQRLIGSTKAGWNNMTRRNCSWVAEWGENKDGNRSISYKQKHT